MKTHKLYFDCKADAKIMKDYLTNIKADCEIKIKTLVLTGISYLEVKTKLTETEFKNLYNI
jgi:hypothetical protein